MRWSSARNGGPRRGFTLIEMAGAAALLMAAMAMTATLLSWVVARRAAVERRQWGAQEAANLMEVWASRSWDDLPAGKDVPIELSSEASKVLSGGTGTLTIIEEPSLPLKRVRIEVRWLGRSGRPEAPARLTTWVGPKGRGAP